MSLSERLLRKFSRPPGDKDLSLSDMAWSESSALRILNSAFPNFADTLRDARVLDFGCGQGHQACAYRKAGAAFVLGLDTNEAVLANGRALAAKQGLASSEVEFATGIPPEHIGSFDVVVSQNSMEHFREPAVVVEYMATALKPGGRLFITFGPPWFAPYGSHMHFFTPLPWVNVFFSERTVMRVRSEYRDDGAMRYEDVENGLNKMTLKKFETIIADSGFIREYLNYRAVKNLPLLTKLPIVREFVCNQVDCILRKP